MLKNQKMYGLFIICFLILPLIVYSIPSKPNELENQTIVDNEYTNAENELQLRYYLRKFRKLYYFPPYSSITLDLNLLVEGSDDIDKVLVMCTPVGNSTFNQSMTSSSTENLYTSSLIVPVPEDAPITGYSPYIIYYEVRYFVNTTSGQSIHSEICPYQFYLQGLHSDGGGVLYDTPDLWYLEGTTGHEITWKLESGSAKEYRLSEDGYLIEHWSWSDPLTINVDELGLGEHVFSIYAYEGGWGDSETVTVHVVTELPFGVNTDDAKPITNILDNPILTPILLVSVGIGSVILIVVILVVYKSRIKNY